MRNFSRTTFLILTIFLCQVGLARESVDLSLSLRCDSVYQPAGCLDSGQSPDLSLAEQIRQNAGIQVEIRRGALPNINREVVSMTAPTAPAPARERATIEDISQSTPAVDSPEAGTTEEGLGGVDENGQGGDQGINFQNPGAPDVMQASAPAGLDGSAIKGGDGLLYSGGAQTDPKVEETGALGQGTSPSQLASLSPGGTSAVDLNNGNTGDTGSSGSGGSFGGGGAGAPLSGNHGDWEGGGGGSAPKSGGGGYLDQLAAIAASMGESFFGASGGGSGSGGLNGSGDVRASRKNARKLASADGSLTSNEEMRRMLQEKMNGRSFASQLEFAGPNSFMFGNMCVHYVSYAKKNGIPNDRAACPTQ